MGEAKFPYPMWGVVCEYCGFVCTIWEKPGTGCSYIEHCPSCSTGFTKTERVDNKEEHQELMQE